MSVMNSTCLVEVKIVEYLARLPRKHQCTIGWPKGYPIINNRYRYI